MRYLVLMLILACGSAQAHSGRTNAQGRHNDRVNGGYHCHGSRPPSAPKPAQSSSSASFASVSDTTVREEVVREEVRVRTPMNFYMCAQHIQYLSSQGLVKALSKNTPQEYEVVLKDGKRVLCQATHHQVIVD